MSTEPASVLDASALLAYLHGEAGADQVEQALLPGAAMSAVNWAEVLSKLAELGEKPAEVSRRLQREGLVGGSIEILNLTAADAVEIARLHVITRRRGLSLGDRACLALGLRLKLPVVTADRTWAGLQLGVTVRAIR